MADDDPDRQRLEDMLKASEQRRPAGGGSSGEGGSGQGSDGPRRESREEPPGDQGAAGHEERPARATGTAKTMVTAGLITGGLSIPGALLPIIGVLLGIAAIVLGVMVSRRAADARAKVAMGLGAVGLVLSIVLGIIGILSLQDENGNGGDDSEDGGGDSEDSGGDSEDSGGDSEDSGGDSEDSGGEDGSSSVLPPYVVAVTLEGRPV